MKQQSIVVLVDSFYENMSMSGNIASKIIDELILRGNDVRVVTFKGINNPRKIENIEIIYVFNWSYYAEIIIKKWLVNSTFWGYRVIYYLKKVLSFICRNISLIGIDKVVERKIEKTLTQLYCEKKFDVVLSIAAPFEFQVANYLFCKKRDNVNSVIYQVDFWATLKDKGMPKCLRGIRKRKRQKMINLMQQSSIMAMTPVVHDKEGNSAIMRIQLPLLKRVLSKKNNEAKIIIVYAGTLNKSERDPSYIIELINMLRLEVEVEFHLYHRGDCDSVLMRYQKKYPNLIINHGSVDGRIAQKAVAEADILLMIGTPQGDQIAGKTFDCISTGKKIIYIAKNKKDINVDFLERYSNKCVIYECDGMEYSFSLLMKFVQNTKNQIISFEDIKKDYGDATPEFFCDNCFG